MGAKIPGTAFMALLLLLLLASSFFLSGGWHSLALKQESVSFSLYSYDRQFAEGQKACFSLEITASNAPEKRQESLLASSGGKTLLAETIEASESGIKGHCFSTQNLGQKNLVEIFIGKENLFYVLEKADIITESTPVVAIEGTTALKGGKAEVRFNVRGLPEHKAVPVEIFVNGKLDHRIYPEGGAEEFSEKIGLLEGDNAVKISALGVSAETTAQYEKPFTLPLFAGLLIIALAFFVLNAFVFGRKGILEGSALSLAGIAALLMANGFALAVFSVLNAFSFSALFLAEIALIVFYFRANFSPKAFQKKISFSLIEIITVLFFVFLTLFLQFFAPSHQTAWSVYYERQANAVAENFGIPAMDELSYLGRPFSFVPGYFLFEGAIYWLTGALGQELFALTLAFSNLFLALAALFFASRLGLKRNQAALFLIFLSMSTFVFTAFTLTPRHGIALAFLFVSLGLLLGKEKFWHSSVFLAAGLAVQIPLAAFYPFLAFFLVPKTEWKKTAKALAGGIALFLPFLALILLSGGVPSQAMPRMWGYLIPMPAADLFMDPGLLLFFFCLSALFEAPRYFSGKAGWDSFRKKLLLGVFASSIAQVFISSRMGLATAVLISAFLAYSLQKYEKELSNLAFFIFGLVLVFCLFLALAVTPYYIYSQQANDALLALKQNSSTGDRVLCDPYYGHKIAFESGRITLADLMVEYADSEKLTDSYRFLDSSDNSILEKYGISLVFAENNAIYRSATETEVIAEPIEFKAMDKVFTNRLISIHRKR
ncbi:MAG: hypothetical protein V1493_02775 [Candidatus Diapherotrites archaeon]